MRLKKVIILIHILIISIVFTSCVGSREVSDLGIVITSAVDIDGEEIVVTLEVIVPQSNVSNIGSNSSDNVIYVQSRGHTVFDALRNATLSFDRRLFMAHNRVIIFGEDFARRGIAGYLNFFINDNEPRESAYLVIAKGSKGHEVMGIYGGLSDTPGKYLVDLLENYEFNGKSRSISINRTIRLALRNHHPVLTVIEPVDQMEFNQENDSPVKTVLKAEGGAVFNIDKLVGYYSGDEMKGFNFIIDEFKNGLIVFETPDELIKDEVIGSGERYSVIEVKKSSTKNEVELVDGKIQLSINVDVKGALMEDTKGLDLIHKDIYGEIELAASKKIEHLIRTTFEKAQTEFKIDTFSIGSFIHRSYPDLWGNISDEWDSIFPDISYTVNVNTDIIRSGLMHTPTNIRKEKK